MDPAEQAQTLERLRCGLEQTKALYDSARDNLARAKELNTNHADAYARIVLAEQLFDEMAGIYRKALKEFNQFILDGKSPPIPAKRIKAKKPATGTVPKGALPAD